MLCAHCGAPIRYSRPVGGYLHAEPLADLRVSRREYQDIMADAGKPKRPADYAKYLHPAEPHRRTV